MSGYVCVCMNVCMAVSYYPSLASVPGPNTVPSHDLSTHLIQRFPRYIDSVDLQDLVVDPQQACALSQAAAHQSGDEHPGDLEQTATTTWVGHNGASSDMRLYIKNGAGG